jgi:hypothetical protein
VKENPVTPTTNTDILKVLPAPRFTGTLADHGIDTSYEAMATCSLKRRANRGNEFAASLLRQVGRWSVKQKAWVDKFVKQDHYLQRELWNREWREACLRYWVNMVGTANAAAYAEALIAEADSLLAAASRQRDNAETHTKWTKRYFDGLEASARTKQELAKEIKNVLAKANVAAVKVVTGA